eukprot:gnl/MRDRNA2_/MRDRNA2_124187_c0_seq1.p1 gnl/MRDRNA2_/MRDRNA2_124187_c0~~gnl/MRDRNA2_/MRDRNA2_124187_c0_seq1.p1  ORF type:complete len:267 (+),score=56.37 gnl/MRDRNA2_/MRDRNA2_124187_c0_seq1:107-907(+)
MALRPGLAMSCYTGVILLLCLCIQAALPPGYEDEIYCPSGYCLRQKSMPPGWTGPRTSFVECASIVDPNLPPKSPTAWGSRLPLEQKDKLTAEGYHQNTCPAKEPEADIVQNEEKENGSSPEEPMALPAPGDSDQLWWQNPKILCGIVVALVVLYFSQNGSTVASASGGAAPTGKSREAMEEARKRHLDRLEKEAQEIQQTDEWKEKEKRAKEEAECRVKAEHRSGTKPGSSGGPSSSSGPSTVIGAGPYRGVGGDRMRPGRGGGG